MTFSLATAPVPADFMRWILETVVRGSIVILVAMVLVWLLRRRSAATRHAVWSVAIAAQIAIPLLSLVLPSWDAGLSSPWVGSTRDAPVSAPAFAGSPGGIDAERAFPISHHDPEEPPATGYLSEAAGWDAAAGAVTGATRPSFIWPSAPLLLAAWLIGFGAIFLRWATGTAIVARMARRSERVAEPHWLALVQRVAEAMAIRRPVALLRSEGLSVPMTCGIIRPVVFLPSDSESWPKERRRFVLVHELAHVKRFDALTQVVTQLALSVFWFNPLVWHAASRLRREGEQACDDFVISLGTRPSRYASDLLALVRRIEERSSSEGAVASAALAMARRSEFEGRILSILDPRIDRGSLSRRRLAGGIALALMAVVPLAAFSPFSPAAASPDPSQYAVTGGRGPQPYGGASGGPAVWASTIARNDQGQIDIDALPVLTYEEAIRVGLEPDPELGMSWVRPPEFGSSGRDAMVIGPDRRLYVADGATIKVFEMDGRLAGTISRRGDAPGELRDPYAIGFLGDTLWAWELSGTSFFNAAGTFLGKVPRRSVLVEPPDLPVAVRVTSDIPRYDGHWALVSRPEDVQQQSLVLPRFRFTHAAELDMTGRQTLEPQAPTLTIAGITVRPSLDVSRTRVIYRWMKTNGIASGELTVDWPQQGIMRLMRTGDIGDTLVARSFLYEPIPIPPSTRDSVAEALVGSVLRNWGMEIQAARDSVNKYMEFLPEYYPPATFIIQAADGRVLIRRDATRSEWRWMVLTPDLRPMAELRVPRDIDLHVLDGDRVWGVALRPQGPSWLVSGSLHSAANAGR